MRVPLPCRLAPVPLISDGDHLAWRRIRVQGRPAEYGTGGDDGPPVVFLHGWGLGSHAYKRAIKRLIARGCRVYAPSLPSFGRTADLPRGRSDLEGYAAWVADFLDEVGVEGPVMVIGHSFGGGVGLKLAQRRPEQVSYLVLANAVGGLTPRPPWVWATGLLAEMWPIPQALQTAQAVSAEMIPNAVRNPAGMLRAARLARTADLRREADELRARHVPVLVLSSEGDGIIPHAAFDALCSAIGSEGRVVGGRHSWMLADPDSFDAALSSLVDVQVSAHRRTTAASRADALVELLSRTPMARRTVSTLVADAPPLWLMSEPAPVLAGDLALCHPRLGSDEIRAVARPMVDTAAVRLTVAGRDRRGFLADSAAVLAAQHLSISGASAATWPVLGLALHSFVVDAGADLDDAAWERLGAALRDIGNQPVRGRARVVRGHHPLRVSVQGDAGDRVLVTIRARDRAGLLADLCRTFADLDANIESLHARTSFGVATDTFLVESTLDADAVHRAFA